MSLQTNSSLFDPLAEIENALEAIDSISTSSEHDPLSSLQKEEVILSESQAINEKTLIKSDDTTSAIIPEKINKVLFTAFIKEFGRYIAISTAVFAVLLVGTNISAYSSIAWNWISPDSLKTSSAEIVDSLSKSKITVFANEGENLGDKKEEIDAIKKKLEEENASVKENIFSPKKLVPTTPSVQVDLDVVPYENRIIIPKIGKNIPLVDVETQNNFDFDHMENIFMQELEKGVVRYPGTATPGNNGNAFIFGHSSNYPWMKGDYNQVFALLDNLEFGDEIIVYYNQKKYTYVIREKKIVKPGDVKVLQRDENKKELSLMTCWPVGTTLKRMIVFSELKEETSVR